MKTTYAIQRATIALICALRTLQSAAIEAEQIKAEPVRLAETVIRTAGINAGLCVELNSTDGRLAAELAGQGKFIVHGITPNTAETQKIRRYLRSRDLHGTVSVEHGSLSRLPYVSNLANLVVVEDVEAALKAGLSLDEVTRVLCPGGVAYLGRTNAPAIVKRKKRPVETDEWTHWLHGPEANNHSSDSLSGPSQRLQWIDGPLWLTGYNLTELFAGR
ncbi:MAG: class I SAM-dependent methyltransferase, partial [Planctomycetota bacterium]